MLASLTALSIKKDYKMKVGVIRVSDGRNGFKQRSPFKKRAYVDYGGLSMGRDILSCHRAYGKGSLSIDDIDSIPGVEMLISVKMRL